MSIKSPTERFCYLCDAVTPEQCICIKKSNQHDCSQPTVGITDIGTEMGMHPIVGTAVAKRNEEEYKRIWNAAIEAAAKVVETNGEARHVRDLKK